jgi:DNA-binding transcriptional regulator YdaS (Cro superfamily)
MRDMNALSRYLKRHGLSQRQFATQAGISVSMVCQCLSGARCPGRSSALKIERVTGGEVPASCWDEKPPKRNRAA